jgi:hypothetical protein
MVPPRITEHLLIGYPVIATLTIVTVMIAMFMLLAESLDARAAVLASISSQPSSCGIHSEDSKTGHIYLNAGSGTRSTKTGQNVIETDH